MARKVVAKDTVIPVIITEICWDWRSAAKSDMLRVASAVQTVLWKRTPLKAIWACSIMKRKVSDPLVPAGRKLFPQDLKFSIKIA